MTQGSILSTLSYRVSSMVDGRSIGVEIGKRRARRAEIDMSGEISRT